MSVSAFEIFIPVRNGGALLSECLDSVLSQADDDFTVTVVDNASTDDTPERVGAKRDARLRHRRFEEGVGLSENFNRCLALARAPLFCLVHADDRLRPDFVGGMKAVAAAYPGAWLAFCRAGLIDENGESLHPLKHRLKNYIHGRRGPVLAGREGLRLLASYNHLMAPCAVYRRELIPPELRFDGDYRYLTDQTFWLRCLLMGGMIAQTDDVFYDHRVHRGQLSSALRANRSTLQEVERFEPRFADYLPKAEAGEMMRIWRRYGRMLALRGFAHNLLSRPRVS